MNFKPVTRNAIVGLLLVFLAGATDALTKPATQPAAIVIQSATQPATQPVVDNTVTLHGQISIASSWDIQRPDLSRVVVYLGSDPVLDAVPRPAGHATVTQKNKAFNPNFTVVTRGTDVEFPNWDCFDHNVFSVSKAAPAFDLDRYPKGQSKTRTFDKVGVVQVFCNIHPQMRAIIFVTPNVYSTRADAQGKFEIKNVPPGNYKVIAWQERCGEQSHDLTVTTGSNADINFTLDENRKSILANSPPEHSKGYGVERGLGVKREHLDLPVVKESHAALDPEK